MIVQITSVIPSGNTVLQTVKTPELPNNSHLEVMNLAKNSYEIVYLDKPLTLNLIRGLMLMHSISLNEIDRRKTGERRHGV